MIARATLASDGLEVRRTRVHGTTDALLARQRVEAQLFGLGASSLGLPAHTLLFAKRIAPRIGIPLDSRACVGNLGKAVCAELGRHAREARRPWLNADAADAETVLFVDEAELVACLVRDWLRGLVALRWWWRCLLGDASPYLWLQQSVLQRGEVLAPVIALLAKAGDAVSFAARIEAVDCERAVAELARSHAIALVTALEDVLRPSPLRRCEDEGAVEVGYGPSDEQQERAVARLVVEAPEAVQLPASEVPQRRLLALALSLNRAPTWTRTPQFALALRAIEHVGAFDAPHFRDVQRVKVPDRSRRGEAREIASKPVAANTPPLQPVFPAPPAAQDRPIDSPERKLVSGLIADATGVHRMEGTQESPTKDDHRVHSGAPVLALPAQGAQAGVVPLAEDGPSRTAADPPHGLGSVRSEPPPVPSLRASPRVATRFGGLFYLLNAALALELYGDFTAPRAANLALSPWDWLAMVGRAWFEEEIVADPVWMALADLAGRAPDEEPGRDFEPPSENWFSDHLAMLHARIAHAIDADESEDVPALVCRHEAAVEITAGMVHVHLQLRNLPLRVRIAGLDRDPGWIPAAGRDVRFHFA